MINFNETTFANSNVNGKAYKVTMNNGKSYVVVGTTLLANGQYSFACPANVMAVVNKAKKEVKDFLFEEQTISMLKIPFKPVNTPNAKQCIAFGTIHTDEEYVLKQYCELYGIKPGNIKCLGVVGKDYILKK